MKLIQALPAAGLLCSGALLLHTTAAPSPSSQPIVPLPVAQTVRMIPMRASNSLVYKGETVSLHFTTPHPGYLGVIDPDGKFFFVVFPAADAVGNLQPLVDGERFCNLASLKINTATLKADPYIYGVYENHPVFTKSGVYRFILGDNLSVDTEDAVSVVRVRYKNTVRPGTA